MRRTLLNRIARRNGPPAVMRRIRRRSRTVPSVLKPGSLVLTDEGLLGRVKRLIGKQGSVWPAELEVDDMNGGTALVSPRDIRLVYR